MGEREAILKCQRGDVEALGVLFELYHITVIRLAYAIVRDHDIAEDITQQVFVRLLSAIKRYDSSRPFAPWLHRVVVNVSLDELRRQRKPDLPLEAARDLQTQSRPPDDAVQQSEDREMLWQALGTLAVKQRAVVMLRYYAGLSESETAAALNCRRGTVKSRLHTALRNLADQLTAAAQAPTSLAGRSEKPPREIGGEQSI